MLHVVIGKGNNVLDNFVAELQAAAEGHSEEHCDAKKQEVLAMKAHQDAKDDLAQFNMLTSEYEKDMKRQWRRNDLSEADRVILEIEMRDVVEERTLLQDTAPRTKAEPKLNMRKRRKHSQPRETNSKMERHLGSLSMPKWMKFLKRMALTEPRSSEERLKGMAPAPSWKKVL
jgi:hypothetical protein